MPVKAPAAKPAAKKTAKKAVAKKTTRPATKKTVVITSLDEKRNWLAKAGLAKANSRGRLSQAAHEAYAKAIKDGIIKDDIPSNEIRSNDRGPAPIRGSYDPKAVREWAATQGLNSGGARGRLPFSTIAAYLEANPNGSGEVKKVAVAKKTAKQSEPKVAKVTTPKQRGPFKQAFTLVFRKPEEAPHIHSVLVQEMRFCGKCMEDVIFCQGHGDKNLPMMPLAATNGEEHYAFLTLEKAQKAAAKMNVEYNKANADVEALRNSRQ